MKEYWRSIPGYEGWYSASNLGNIRRDKSACRTSAGRILKKQLNPRGYSIVSINNQTNHAKTLKVSYLVSLTFFGPRVSGHVINHRNGIKTDDRVNNLEYITQSMNVMHAYEVLKHKPPSGLNHWNGMKKECKRGHLFSEDNTRYRNGRRICKQCVQYRKKKGKQNGQTHLHQELRLRT